MHKILFNFRWSKGNKYLSLINYKEAWIEYGNKPMWKIRTNGASKKNGSTCLDIHVHLGYWVLNYTNFNLQGI